MDPVVLAAPTDLMLLAEEILAIERDCEQLGRAEDAAEGAERDEIRARIEAMRRRQERLEAIAVRRRAVNDRDRAAKALIIRCRLDLYPGGCDFDPTDGLLASLLDDLDRAAGRRSVAPWKLNPSPRRRHEPEVQASSGRRGGRKKKAR